MPFPSYELSKTAWMKPLTYSQANVRDRGPPLGQGRGDHL